MTPFSSLSSPLSVSDLSVRLPVLSQSYRHWTVLGLVIAKRKTIVVYPERSHEIHTLKRKGRPGNLKGNGQNPVKERYRVIGCTKSGRVVRRFLTKKST